MLSQYLGCLSGGEASQRGVGLPRILLPASWLIKLYVMLPSVLFGWRQNSLGTEESQLEESKSE